MADVQSILLSCKVLEFYCHVAGDGVGVAADLESRLNQGHALTSRVLWCLVRQRNFHGDGDAKERSRWCQLELRADILTIAPDDVRRALEELTASVAVPGTVQIVDRYSTAFA